jgi:GT2 family glycosyltransferase
MINMTMYDAAGAARIVGGGGGFCAVKSGVNVAGARNFVVSRFLEFTTAEWLLFIDTDMVFDPFIVEQLLDVADPEEAPIVGALCFGVDNGRLFPTMYDLIGSVNKPQFVRYDTWPIDAMFQVAATGTGCLLIHRNVLTTMRDYGHSDGRIGFSKAFPWFQECDFFGVQMGEDVTFCVRAGQCGFPIHVNTGIQVGHIKSHLLTKELYLMQCGLLAPTAITAGRASQPRGVRKSLDDTTESRE